MAGIIPFISNAWQEIKPPFGGNLALIWHCLLPGSVPGLSITPAKLDTLSPDSCCSIPATWTAFLTVYLERFWLRHVGLSDWALHSDHNRKLIKYNSHLSVPGITNRQCLLTSCVGFLPIFCQLRNSSFAVKYCQHLTSNLKYIYFRIHLFIDATSQWKPKFHQEWNCLFKDRLQNHILMPLQP